MKKESKLYSGTICVTDLMEQLKSGHSAFTKFGGNGKIYCNVLLWENQELDKFNNTHSLQLNSKKENKDTEKRVYLGNFKPIEKKTVNSEISKDDLSKLSVKESDLPF